MIIHQTKLMKESAQFPTLLDFKDIANSRGLIQTKNERQDYKSLKLGSAGEAKFLSFLQAEGAEHWIGLTNLWLHDGRSFECDFVLITSYCVYVFEIKNYTGHFIYEDARCMIGQLKMDYDVIQQARKSYLKLQKICQEFMPTLPVKGAIVFIGEKNKVSIKSPISDIEVLQLTDLYEYIQQIKQEERRRHHHPIQTEQLLAHLEQYEIRDPFLPQPFSKAELATARKGIYCSHCQNYELQIKKHYVICSCGMHEPREEAIVRSACEYGALTFGRNFSTGDIVDFIDHQASHVYVKKVLNKHFVYTSNRRFSYHHTKNLPYERILEHFNFSLSKKFYTNRANGQWFISD